MLLLVACTGQSPATLKNSTSSKLPFKSSCNNIKLSGQILSQENILSVFECSGWDKVYPHLTSAIRASDQTSVDRFFFTFNQVLLSGKEQQKKLFEVLSLAEEKGDLDDVARLLQKLLLEHRLLTQLGKFIKSSDSMKFLSSDNETNIKGLRALKVLAGAFEEHREALKKSTLKEDTADLKERFIRTLDEVTTEMERKHWGMLSQVAFSQNRSPLKDWSAATIEKGPNVLLQIMKQESFLQDVRYLKKALDEKVSCPNRSDKRDFTIDVRHELAPKIESLKVSSIEEFQRTLLDGLAKYLAFEEFCEENTYHQGLSSFFNVLNNAYKLSHSDHDFIFLKRLHQIFGQERFQFVNFLSSQSFSSLRGLMLQSDADELVLELHSVVNSLNENELKTFSEMMTTFPTKWFTSWSSSWKKLSHEEKVDFVHMLEIISEDQVFLSSGFGVMESIFLAFPELSSSLYHASESETFVQDLISFIGTFAQDEVQDDLSRFFSDKGIFEFIKIVNQDRPHFERNSRSTYTSSSRTEKALFVLRPEHQNATEMCFEGLSKEHEEGVSYYQIVNTLPDECLNSLGATGLVGQIYLWSNSVQKDLYQRYGITDYHSGTGVWSPGMLQFIFSAAIKADKVLQADDGKTGILPNLDEIYKEVTAPHVLESFRLFSKLYVSLAKKTPFEKKLEEFLNKKSNSEINAAMNGLLRLSGPGPSLYNLKSKATSCRDLSDDLGAKACLSAAELKKGTVELIKILGRKNEAGNSLLQELLKWLHPQGGVNLPQGIHRATFEEAIGFLRDLSSAKTQKEFIYNTGRESLNVQGNSLDRLEVVIRDIGFTNNFYGAYFKNVVATSEDYRNNVIASEKLLVWLDRFSGLFRSWGLVPEETKWKLKNVRNTYWSLVEVSDSYVQPDGSSRTYDGFIQGLLMAIRNSSKSSTQNFNAYRKPDPKLVEGHNGVFLTRLVEMSGLRHLARFAGSRFSTPDIVTTREFQTVEKNLLGRHDLMLVQKEAQRIFDLYFNGENSPGVEMVSSLIDFISRATPEQQRVLEEVSLKAILLLSSEKMSTQRIQDMAGLIEIVLRSWRDLNSLVKDSGNAMGLLQLLNSLLDRSLEDSEALDDFLKFILDSHVFDASDFDKIISDPSLGELLKQMRKGESTHLNWHQTMTALFSGSHDWSPFMAWLKTALSPKSHQNLSFSVLLQYLGEKDRLKMVFDELLRNHRGELKSFINDTFHSLDLKPD